MRKRLNTREKLVADFFQFICSQTDRVAECPSIEGDDQVSTP